MSDHADLVQRWVVMTTIHPPNDALDAVLDHMGEEWSIVVVGDDKTPDDWAQAPVHYLSMARQQELFGEFAARAPANHYCRKNFGYLYAIMHGARCIFETDDDTYPYADFWGRISPRVTGRRAGGATWLNVYAHFSEDLIWPRGLPLDAIHDAGRVYDEAATSECAIQQYLVDSDPDVDAIYRLLFPGRALKFDSHATPVILEEGAWVPFNSQNTLFFRDAFSLLYLPHYVSFRMTDIWRAFVAQAALWNHGGHLAFHTASARQLRNAHDLMQDFAQEVPGYLHNRAIAAHLDTQRHTLGVDMGMAETARRLWHLLLEKGYLQAEEAPLIDMWYRRLESAMQTAGTSFNSGS